MQTEERNEMACSENNAGCGTKQTDNMNKENDIRSYADMVYRLAFSRTGSQSDADDIFQEVFLRYIQEKKAFLNEEHKKVLPEMGSKIYTRKNV